MSKLEIKQRCEAVYGDNRCNKDADDVVISNGQIFCLCKECAKLARKQIKLNSQ